MLVLTFSFVYVRKLIRNLAQLLKMCASLNALIPVFEIRESNGPRVTIIINIFLAHNVQLPLYFTLYNFFVNYVSKKRYIIYSNTVHIHISYIKLLRDVPYQLK
jgi:hypothetical protein